MKEIVKARVIVRLMVIGVIIVTGRVWGAAKEPWRDTAVNSINRMEARALLVPAESEDLAIAIARMSKPSSASRWVMNLNGEWDFKWKRTPANDWEKTARIQVPSCWQLQGEYDPPLYINARYPLAGYPTGDVMTEPPTNYTSYVYRNPVGLYTTNFKRPWHWYFRRTVLRLHGVSSACYVRVNGKLVGYAEDSRLPSEFDLSDYLKWFGQNKLEIEVYKHSDGTYLEDQDFWRLSGIFRDVTLISENRRAPYDLQAVTTLNGDFSHGQFKILNEKGECLKLREVDKPLLWSPETPNVYVTPIEHHWGWWIFSGVDYYAVTFGFRKVEIRDGIFTLNGKRAVIRGVNRHEMEPETGYTVTSKGMACDVALMKDNNFNAVRTSHYPNVPEWYSLCDREGLMVCCEANVEANGVAKLFPLGNPESEALPRNPLYHDAIIERQVRMVKFFRNHPSIVMWSLGNEAGPGKAMDDGYVALKQLDPTRPIHYQSTPLASACTDFDSMMYSSPTWCENWLAKHNTRPFVLCEYTHAMGNSNGDVDAYWKLIDKYPHFCGAFVWDFADQALWKTDAHGRYLAFGGDHGETPNDRNFNCNGLFDALRRPHPGLHEIAHAQQPIKVRDFDWHSGAFTVVNDYMFLSMDDVESTVSVMSNGRELARFSLTLDGIAAGATRRFSEGKGSPLNAKLLASADAVMFKFQGLGGDSSHDQFYRPFRPRQIDPKGGELMTKHGFKYNFYRAPTDNDRGWKMPKICRVWKDATDTQQLPPGVKSDLKVWKFGENRLLVDWTLTVPKGLPPIPRVGLSFELSRTDANPIEWYGLGPWENYSDRSNAAWLGSHSVKRVDFNPEYIKPSERGYRTGCRALRVDGVMLVAINAPFGFNVWPYPQSMLEDKWHNYELVESERDTVNIDAAQMGVGGDDSWRARPHEQFMLGEGTYRLVFTMVRQAQ